LLTGDAAPSARLDLAEDRFGISVCGWTIFRRLFETNEKPAAAGQLFDRALGA
jgi:hypothetical protein